MNRTNDIDQELFNKIETKIELAGYTKEEVVILNGDRPCWLSQTMYFFMTLLCMGWIVRFLIYNKTVSINFYLKKIILR